MPPLLSHDEAKAFYDRFGARQDKQAFYEDAALDRLVANSRFGEARAVFEFGCGTGRLAERLLARHLPDGAAYTGVDSSATMVALAVERLARWPAKVTISDGGMTLPAPGRAFDRIVATYVLDLLSEADGQALIAEAHRTLMPGGLLWLPGSPMGSRRAFGPGYGALERGRRAGAGLGGRVPTAACRPPAGGRSLAYRPSQRGVLLGRCFGSAGRRPSVRRMRVRFARLLSWAWFGHRYTTEG